MNERIKELAEQAGIVFWEISGDVDWRQANRETLEKFAELIVRECMEQCQEIAVGADKIANSQFVTDAGRMLHQGMWGGAKNCIVQIKEHFGVE